MNYLKIYNSIVYKRQVTEPLTHSKDCYTENHHIVPKCLGGSDISENMIRLTAREHFIAHVLLHKINPNENSLLYAANMMSHFDRNTSKEYAWLKEKCAKVMKETRKGIPWSDERKLKAAETREKNKANGKIYKHKTPSEEEKLKRAETVAINKILGKVRKDKGSPKSKETKEKAKLTKEKNMSEGKDYKINFTKESIIKRNETRIKNTTEGKVHGNTGKLKNIPHSEERKARYTETRAKNEAEGKPDPRKGPLSPEEKIRRAEIKAKNKPKVRKDKGIPKSEEYKIKKAETRQKNLTNS